MTSDIRDESLDDGDLRKAWLKQYFSSYDYRKKLLQLHEQWLALIRTALARARAEDANRHGAEHPTDILASEYFQGPKVRRTAAEHFEKITLPKLETVEKADEFTMSFWEAHPATSGGFRFISDYGSNIMYDDYWTWATPNEYTQIFKIWMLMQQMCTNIRQTLDNLWDDDILVERYTGPIIWPDNWQKDVLGDAASLLDHEAATRVKAGEAVIAPGTYQAIDPRVRRFKVKGGDTLPDLGSAYGTTVWQLIED